MSVLALIDDSVTKGILIACNSRLEREKMTQSPLISVLVLCYNNQELIYENLQSIFSQTYPNIEILIADDASESFDARALLGWINRNRTPNISKISLYENPVNCGTVASLENLQNKSSGEFLFNIAADDVLFDENVLQAMYQKAVEIGEDAEWIVTETEMWDHTLTTKLGDFLKEEGINKIKNSTPMELFAECSWHPFLPACYLYRRSLLKKIGPLSEKYRLIEDWPMSLIATRMGIVPYYCDIQSSIKHRDGGISHGNTVQSRMVFLRYYQDLCNVFNTEVYPYLDLLNESDRIRAEKYGQDRFRAYYKIHIPAVHAEVDATPAPAEAKPAAEPDPIILLSGRELLREKIKRLAYCLAAKRTVLQTLLLMFLFLLLAVLMQPPFSEITRMLFAVLTALAGLAVAGEAIIHYYLRYRQSKWGKE